MQAPLQTDSRRRRQTLFNSSHNKPKHLSPLLINLCLLSRTRCHTDFLLLSRGRRESAGCKIPLRFHASGLCVSGLIHLVKRRWCLTFDCTWAASIYELHTSVSCKLIFHSVPLGYGTVSCYFILIWLSRTVNIIHKSLCTGPGVRLYWRAGRGIFHNEILFCFFVPASLANIGVKLCGCADNAKVDSERQRRRHSFRLESGLQHPIIRVVNVRNPRSASRRATTRSAIIGCRGFFCFFFYIYFSYDSNRPAEILTSKILKSTLSSRNSVFSWGSVESQVEPIIELVPVQISSEIVAFNRTLKDFQLFFPPCFFITSCTSL